MADRKEILKDIIRSLHEGATVEEAKERFAREVGAVDTAELVSIEQSLIEEGLTPEEVTKFCNVHVALVQDSLEADTRGGGEPPAVTFLRSENAVVRGLVAKIRRIAAMQATGRPLNEVLSEIEDEMDMLRRVTHHYSLKENTLFPHLEQHGFPGPSQVMWEKDNEIRNMLRSVTGKLKGIDSGEDWQVFVKQELEPLLDEIDGMVDKEEDILLPAAMERFSSEEWAQISIALEESSPAFGAQQTATDAEAAPEKGTESAAVLSEGVIEMPSGRLSVAELVPMLNTLPFDITFVNAEDRVAYFSEGKERIFMRTRSIIGRKVQNCHPPKSLDAVEKIVASFKDGSEDVHDFWIRAEDRLIYIRYFAVRDTAGKYLGTMEITQDVTDIRKLEGEKRLLD